MVILHLVNAKLVQLDVLLVQEILIHVLTVKLGMHYSEAPV